MRSCGLLCLLGALACFATEPGISHSEYRQRRASLKRSLPDSLIVFFGGKEQEHGDLRSGFFQDADFYYLTGWTEPGAILVLTPSSEILLIPKRNAEQERWTGRKLAPGDPNVGELTGFESVIPSRLSNRISRNGLNRCRMSTPSEFAAGRSAEEVLPLTRVSSAAMPMAPATDEEVSRRDRDHSAIDRCDAGSASRSVETHTSGAK